MSAAGLFPKSNTRIGGRHKSPAERGKAWPKDKIDQLCDLVADGRTFADIATIMKVTRNAAMGQFHRIRQAYGWQGE